MKCKKCNNEIVEGALFCTGCLTSVEELKKLGMIEETINSTNEEKTVVSMPVVEENFNLQSTNQAVSEKTFQLNDITRESVETFKQPTGDSNMVSQTTPSTVEVPSQEMPNNEVEINVSENNKNNSKKKKSLVPMIGVIAAIILILGAGFLIYLRFSPKIAFQSMINQSLKQFEKSIGLDYETISTDFDLKINVDAKSEEQELLDLINIINKFKLSGKVENDYKNNRSFVSLIADYENDNIINMDMFMANEKMYIMLNNLYDKYIEYDIEGIEFEKPLTEEYNIITKSLFKALKNNLKPEYFKKINGEEYNNTLQLTYKQVDDVARGILKDLKKDDKFITSLAEITKEEKDKLIESFDEILSTEHKSSELDEEIALTINFYTEKFSNDVKKIEIKLFGSVITIDFEDENNIVYKIDSERSSIIIKVLSSKNGEKDRKVLMITYDDFSIAFDYSYSIKYDEKITEPNVSNNINYKNLSEEDISKISDDFMKSKGVDKLLEDSGVKNQIAMANKKSFKLYGERVVSSAMNSYESDKLLGIVPKTINGYCYYTLEDLHIDTTGSYDGFVEIRPYEGGADYLLYLTDGNYSYNGATSSEVYYGDSINVDEYNVQAVYNSLALIKSS